MPGKKLHRVDTDGCRERGYELGPLGIRTFNNPFGWGVTVWVGKASIDVAWDK